MRWLLFDLVVGATLVWLVWGARAPEAPTVSASAPATAAGPVSPAPMAVAIPRETPPPVAAAPSAVPVGDRQSVVAPPPEPGSLAASASAAVPEDAATATAPARDRGERLRALAREAEALFVRARE